MISSARRIALFAAAAIPFLLLPLVLPWSIGPAARAGAHWFHLLADRLPCATESNAPRSALTPVPHGEAGDRPVDEAAPGNALGESTPESGPASNGATRAQRADPRAVRPAYRAPANRPSIASIGGPFGAEGATHPSQRPHHVFVGPESVQRAIPAPGRPTSAWTDRTVEHPAGLLIQNPGVLTGVIEPGDILIEAEGQPLGSFEQLVVTVKQAYERRAKRLSGRIFRQGHFVPVTVEPGW